MQSSINTSAHFPVGAQFRAVPLNHDKGELGLACPCMSESIQCFTHIINFVILSRSVVHLRQKEW